MSPPTAEIPRISENQVNLVGYRWACLGRSKSLVLFRFECLNCASRVHLQKPIHQWAAIMHLDQKVWSLPWPAEPYYHSAHNDALPPPNQPAGVSDNHVTPEGPHFFFAPRRALDKGGEGSYGILRASECPAAVCLGAFYTVTLLTMVGSSFVRDIRSRAAIAGAFCLLRLLTSAVVYTNACAPASGMRQ